MDQIGQLVTRVQVAYQEVHISFWTISWICERSFLYVY